MRGENSTIMSILKNDEAKHLKSTSRDTYFSFSYPQFSS